jgi:hypothetical protein
MVSNLSLLIIRSSQLSPSQRDLDAAEAVGVLGRNILALLGQSARAVPDDGAAGAAAVDRVEDELTVGALGGGLEGFAGDVWVLLVRGVWGRIGKKRGKEEKRNLL